MSLKATAPVEASAEISLRVPRGGSDDLESGVADVVENVDGVAEVTVRRVRGVRPTFTDLRVDADLRVSIAVPDIDDIAPETAATDCLADGFGILAVDRLAVEDA
ncbi:hypothetical protein [Haloarcula nitratireducens]|uniref:Uncharacterized protein n=1 Tax=Haloarcula nitratireducens TaxID=2487749 RepID=A0AAW4P9C4_9EURY|nr:hypothetical protein [Halomicroarcula nitratireducens]MBX0294542.1 hypothetical protein [Halomicroarcula nitratireducens]